jgi:hypothetical protein
MNHDDELDRDPDLESRLHRISQDPEPQVSGRVYRYVQSVVSGAEDIYGPARSKLRPLAGPRLLRMPKLVAVTGLAAALGLAIAGTLLVTTLRPKAPAATPRYAGMWSALEWHDITSTAFPASSQPGSEGIGSGAVVAWKGGLLANPQGNLWSSIDGQTWRQLGNVPSVLNLLATKDWLLGIGLTPTPCQENSPGICENPGAIWYSADGVAWKEAQVPFTGDLLVGYAANNTGAVVLASPYTDNSDPTSSPTTPYASSDGATWAKATVPADLAGATMTTVTSTRAGFVISGFVADPAGSVELGGANASGQFTVKGFERDWFSADGLAWSTYDPGPAAGHAGFRVYGGSLGDAMSPVFDGVHSADGLHWTRDETNLSPVGMIQESSDGTEILVQGEGPVFTVGLGDGRWQRLQNVGDIGSLPRGGQSWVVPGGVIYDAGGRVYYGKALTGVTPTQTLHPGPTTTLPPGPTLKPLPSVSLAPAAGWSGLGALQKLPDGPAGVSSVAAWAHGYVAVRNAPAGGKIAVWDSPDGRTWTVVPAATFTGSSAVVAAAGDSVVLASWNDGNGVWVSADGVNWTPSPMGNPPIGDRPMVGDGRGMVAVEDDPQYQLVYSGTGSDTWYTTTLPGASVDNVQSVALSGDRFVAVGKMPGPDSGMWAPTAWWSKDGSTWTQSIVPDAVGQGFVSIAAGRKGFVATSKSVDGGGTATLWSSPDGATWRKLGSSSPLGPDAILAGDGTHILGCDVVGVALSCWSSLDGEVWTSLPLQGDTSQLIAAGTSLRVFPLRDGVLFVTADGVWFGQAAAR